MNTNVVFFSGKIKGAYLSNKNKFKNAETQNVSFSHKMLQMINFFKSKS